MEGGGVAPFPPTWRNNRTGEREGEQHLGNVALLLLLTFSSGGGGGGGGGRELGARRRHPFDHLTSPLGLPPPPFLYRGQLKISLSPSIRLLMLLLLPLLLLLLLLLALLLSNVMGFAVNGY